MRKILLTVSAVLLTLSLAALGLLTWQAHSLGADGLYVVELHVQPDPERLYRAADWYQNVAVELAGDAAILSVDDPSSINAYRSAQGVLGILNLSESKYTLYEVAFMPQSIAARLRLMILCAGASVAVLLSAWIYRSTRKNLNELRRLDQVSYAAEILRRHPGKVVRCCAAPACGAAVIGALWFACRFQPQLPTGGEALGGKLWSTFSGAGLLPPAGMESVEMAGMLNTLNTQSTLSNLALAAGIIAAVTLVCAVVGTKHRSAQ